MTCGQRSWKTRRPSPGLSRSSPAAKRAGTFLVLGTSGNFLGYTPRPVSPPHASGAMYRSTAQKWQALPAKMKRCHNSWNPNTPGTGFGRFSP